MPKIHHREMLVRDAELKIHIVLSEATKGLTSAEVVRVVTSATSTFLLSFTKYLIREERHGDTDKPGGLE